MVDDLNVNIDDVLQEDDASRYKESLTLKGRRALDRPDRLVEGQTGLSQEERRAVDKQLSPDRPGFAEAMQGVLK
jgi:hypothetical protein